MTRCTLVVSAIAWILALATALLAAAVGFGVPLEFHLDPERIHLEPENAYRTRLPELPWPLTIVSDGPDAPRASIADVLETGRPLGPAHVGHASIRSVGRGRYSHWQGELYFSTSDNSDPRTNGRQYVVAVRGQIAPQVLLAWLLFLGLAGAGVSVFWLRRDLIDLPDLLLPLGLWVGTALSLGAVSRAGGIVLWLLLGVGAVSLTWAVAMTHRTIAKGTRRPSKGTGAAQNATLLAASVTFTLMGAEALLIVWERRTMEAAAISQQVEPRVNRKPARPRVEPPPLEAALESFGVKVPREVLRTATQRSALITLPPELDYAPLEVDGATHAYRWHGAIHVKDINDMRRTTPFPARRDDVLRVMVVGDSFTYGDGIEERWTYARQLERLLEPDYDVEVLNLGGDGQQSEDVLDTVNGFLNRLRPDLVVYGVCINDFLPSRTGQYWNSFAYAIPLPEPVKTFFTDNSRLARLSEDAYNRALLEVGLRADFYDDILNDFADYQKRFARDVARMNQLVTGHGLPPVIALTLDRRPIIGARGYHITRVAERFLKDAGMDVIEMDRFYRQFNGTIFRVSRWEGHPNEIANAIWATMLNRHLRRHDVLRQFRKGDLELL